MVSFEPNPVSVKEERELLTFALVELVRHLGHLEKDGSQELSPPNGAAASRATIQSAIARTQVKRSYQTGTVQYKLLPKGDRCKMG